METITILSSNYIGKVAHIVFFPDSLGSPVDLGYQTIPYQWTTDDWYGSVHLYFEEYDSTCVIESLRPTSTPTPTPTQTPMGASITIVNQPKNCSIDEYRGSFTVGFRTTSPSTTTVTMQKQTNGLGEFVDQYTTLPSELYQIGSIFEAFRGDSFGSLTNADYFDTVATRDKYRFVISSGANSIISDTVQYTFSGSNRGPSCSNIGSLGGSNNKITTVGTNGGSSYYGTYDQGGLVYEWNDALEMFNRQYQRGIRSGHWAGGNVSMGHTDSRFFNNPGINLNEDGTVNSYPIKSDVIGFRLSSLTDPLDYHSFTSGLNEFLTVGDLGNPPYLNYTVNNAGGQAQYGYAYKFIGKVDYEYKIMKYPVTNAEYVLFLNAADPEGNRYDFYDSKMSSDVTGGILFNNSAPFRNKYSVKTNMGNKPVVFIDWFSAVKFANWLHNKAVLGYTPLGLEYTLDGAYTLNEYQPNIQANQNALYRVPTEDEWLKAGYYKGPDPLNSRKPDQHYWNHPTRHAELLYDVTFDSFGNGIIPQKAYY
jgi:formylglycine-generating enzyme required for sulfatase activity